MRQRALIAREPGLGLRQGDAVQRQQQLLQHRFVIQAELGNFGNCIEQAGDIAGLEPLQDALDEILVNRAQHRAHFCLIDLAAAVGNRLIQQRQAVAHAAIGGARQQPDGGGVMGNAFRIQNFLDLRTNLLQRQAFQVELQAARQHRHRQLLRIGGGEQEFDVRRRLFQCFQQRVEAVAGEHVHFVNEIDLVAAARGRVLHVVEQLARVVHLGARGRVHLDQVHETALVHFLAGTALAAGLRGHAGFAIQGFGENAGDGGLAHAAGAGKEEGMMQAAVIQRVDQRLHHVLLAHQLGEVAWAPFAREDLITQLALPSIRLETGGGSSQPHPSTRNVCCGCFLPDLTGFTSFRRRGDRLSPP